MPKKRNILERLFPDKKIQQKLKKAILSKPLEDIEKEFPNYRGLTKSQRHDIAEHLGVKRPFRGAGSLKTKKHKQKEKPPSFSGRKWAVPEAIEIKKRAWERPGSRVAYFSYGPYRKEGWRRGLIKLAGLIAATIEGAHFPVFAGGLIDKEWMAAEIKRLGAGVSKRFLPMIKEHIIQETSKALSSTLPIFKKPNGEFVRWYIMVSEPHDGPYGEEIVRRLQEMPFLSIRQYKTGGERIEIKQIPPHRSIYHGVVLPKARRLPSKYMSAKVERDIEDVEEQTSREFPNLWIHGTSATALYKPAGERSVGYISLPALHKIEAQKKKVVENQVGFTIVEEMPDGDRLIHFWSFRDLIARERDFITGIKRGANKFHREIIEIIKREGARHPGRLADELGVKRETLEQNIKFLVETERSPRLTWPGLHYDASSQRYDFYLDWLQEKLTYVLPSAKNEWNEDSFLFFGCLHAGHTCTDYEFVVKKFPDIILKYDIKILGGIGDFIAGLRHSVMHRGEIFQMNNTEQEQFAAEIIATIMFKVFSERFEKRLKLTNPDHDKLKEMIDSSLMLFLIKKGNHDRWQESEGTTALDKFCDTLRFLLIKHITLFLASKQLDASGAADIIQKKIVLLPEHKPVYTLPSGIKVGLMHPHMARADTTSLRAEKTLKKFVKNWGCQVVGIANFHVSVFAHKWWPKVGQSVAAQVGTQVIFTDYEFGKTKDLDFGPLYLKTLSCKGRIFKTTLAAFEKPMLSDPLPKWTNITELKKKLRLLE